MANLAIKGHATRGSEVISLLEMLGGKIRRDRLAGDELFSWYYINGNGYIDYKHYSLFNDTTCFTLEEFEEKFPYKVGDKVWLHYENPTTRVTETITCMRWCNKWNYVLYDVYTCGNLRESAFTPYKEEETTGKEIIYDEIDFNRCPCADKVQLILGDDFEIKEEDGKTFVVRRENQYPKTYEECCEILDILGNINIEGYKKELLLSLQKLLICRDAYWKIAGDWKPEWLVENKYTIHTSRDKIVPSTICNANTILVFPTKEMRDAFYGNFKELIEAVKELL